MRLRLASASLLFSLLATAASSVSAEDPAAPEPPRIAEASPEAERSIAGFRVPAGFDVSLFAAEPLLANPVAFGIDERGRVYVCESFRQDQGVTDNRSHDERWLDADLAAQTVADRIRYHQELLGDAAAEYTRHDDRLRLLEDTNGDGRADKATVFADHFNRLEEGTGAGVLAYRGDVFYTCIPRLWKLRDHDGDGRADERTALHDGYGVRVAFRGHDLHGLILGPDGRLYFSVGDRGYHVKVGERTLADPESGAVFRCNLDGSELEVFATGLRNPQELAFDEFGNLFTGDNNSDSGDRARWVYVVAGGDTGWRMSYQYLPDRGPFNREKIWHPFHPGQPAYIVPPIANFADGPSGLAYYPGTGLAEHYAGRFFLCDFRGGPANSGIRSFRVAPQGAFFELTDTEETFWNILATDVAFGPDGGIYVADWVNGWNGEGKGRIYRFAMSGGADESVVREVRQILAEGLENRASDEVAALLGHRDQRVRQAAQFELVARGADAQLHQVARDAQQTLLARIHAVWGIEQRLRHEANSASTEILATLLADPEGELRAQAAKMLGEARVASAQDALVERLSDEQPRVRYFAAAALGRIGNASAVPQLLALLAANADQDPIVRHGAIMGLAGCGDVEALVAAATHPSRSARLGAIVALRRLARPEIARYLQDPDAELVVEAARAIHDLPIAEALPDLAALAATAPQHDALMRRVLNANFRLGGAEHAEAVARFAAREQVAESLRLEALRMLADWATPSSRDRVLGMWRPLGERSPEIAREALSGALAGILTASGTVRDEALQIAARLGLGEVAPTLKTLLADRSQPAAARASALGALRALGDAELAKLAEQLLGEDETAVRLAALEVLADQQPDRVLPLLDKAVMSEDTLERQGAYEILGQVQVPAARTILIASLERLLAGDLPADTQLDVLEAARLHTDPQVRQRVEQYEERAAAEGPLGPFRESLAGGNAERGRRIFFERTEVSCVRCHKVRAVGGEVGPDLSEIAKTKTPEYLLEAIVAPNKTIAEKFASVLIADVDGRIHSGIVRSENAKQVELITAEGTLVVIPQESIEQRSAGKSAMPEDLVQKLSKRDLRDLVAWLSSLQ